MIVEAKLELYIFVNELIRKRCKSLEEARQLTNDLEQHIHEGEIDE